MGKYTKYVEYSFKIYFNEYKLSKLMKQKVINVIFVLIKPKFLCLIKFRNQVFLKNSLC